MTIHVAADTGTMNPISKVLQILTDFEAKVIKDGEEEQAAYVKYAKWCENGALEKQFEIKTAKADIAGLTATINKADSDRGSAVEAIDSLAQEISTDEQDLAAQTKIRKQEKTTFLAAETELVDTIDTLERATNILQRKLSGAALLATQVSHKSVGELLRVLSQVVEAAGLELHDKQRLLSLAQSGDQDDDTLDGEALGAPQAAAYESKSGSIIDVLEELKEKAENQLGELRRSEVASQHNFEMAAQALEDSIKVNNKEMDDQKTLKHNAAETKAQAQGELTITKKDLMTSESTLRSMKSDCQEAAEDHEQSVKSRSEELKAITVAKKVLKEMTSGAEALTYGSAASFLQMRSHQAPEVATMLRQLAHREHSAALAQLAGKVASALKESSLTGEHPFAKVKDLISDMIARLEKDAAKEADHKAYCDKEFGATKTKLDEFNYDIEKLDGKLDKDVSETARLKDDVVELQRELAAITKSQAEADALRMEEHKVYVTTKADLELGLEGLRVALRALREYFANDVEGASLLQQPARPGTHEKATGIGSSVIGLLEVVESDFSKNLANVELEEDTQARDYERLSMENRLSKASKEKDVKYKTKEAAALEKAITEMKSDLKSNQEEKAAVLEYSEKIRGMCELKPESYEDRAQRRVAEIEGLRQALQALEAEGASFVQTRLRGVRRH